MSVHPVCRKFCMKPNCRHGFFGPKGPECPNTFTIDDDNNLIGYNYERLEKRSCQPYTLTRTISSGPFFRKAYTTKSITLNIKYVNVHYKL